MGPSLSAIRNLFGRISKSVAYSVHTIAAKLTYQHPGDSGRHNSVTRGPAIVAREEWEANFRRAARLGFIRKTKEYLRSSVTSPVDTHFFGVLRLETNKDVGNLNLDFWEFQGDFVAESVQALANTSCVFWCSLHFKILFTFIHICDLHDLNANSYKTRENA